MLISFELFFVDAKNFSPISLLMIIPNVTEKVIHNKTMITSQKTTFSTDTNLGFAKTTQQTLLCHI